MFSTPAGIEPQPIQPQPTTRIGRLQLAAIGAVVVLAAGIGLVLGFTILSERGESGLGPSAEYVPADAVVYMEARLDLPAGQRESLRAILERFPAADADAILGDALAETLDDALAGAPVDYSGDVAPWFDGRAAISLLDYPLNADPMAMQLPSTAALFGVRDAAAAGAFTDTLKDSFELQGSTFTSADHGGTTIWTLDVEAMMSPVPMAGVGFSYALTDDQLLLANGQATIETLLDVRGGNGDSLAQRDELADLSEHVPAEWAGVMTIDLAAMLAEARAQLEASSPELAEAMSAYLDAVPSFVVTTIGFEDDAVRFDGVTTMPGGDFAPSNGFRGLAASVPADAIFFADGPNVGSGLAQAIAGMRGTLGALPDGGTMEEQIAQAEAALGADLEDFVSWIGSGAMAAGWDGSAPWAGLVLEAADPDAAARRLGQLRSLVELAAMDPQTQVTIETETIAGVEVTTIAALTGQLGDEVTVVQYALDGDRALIGFGDSFVGHALEVAPEASLAGSDRFEAALTRFGGADNAGAFFLDLAALRDAASAGIPDLGTGAIGDEVWPNLEPLDYLAGVTRVEDGAVVSRFGLVLR